VNEGTAPVVAVELAESVSVSREKPFEVMVVGLKVDVKVTPVDEGTPDRLSVSLADPLFWRQTYWISLLP